MVELAGIFSLAEQVNAELGELRAINLDDLNLELHLPEMRLSDDHRIDHVLGVQTGQLDRRLRRKHRSTRCRKEKPGLAAPSTVILSFGSASRISFCRLATFRSEETR